MLRLYLVATAVTQVQERQVALQLPEVSRLDGEEEELALNSIQPWHRTIARGLRVKYDPGTWGRRASTPPPEAGAQSHSKPTVGLVHLSVPAGPRKIRLCMGKPGTRAIMIIPSIEEERPAG